MRHEFSFFGIAIAITLAGMIAGCQRGGETASSDADRIELPGIEIEAEESAPLGEGQPAPGEPGKFTRVYSVPPSFMEGLGGEKTPSADPFAAPSGSDRTGIGATGKTGKEVLQEYGMTEPDLSGAHYDPGSNELTVVATPEQLAFVDEIMEALQLGMSRAVNVRIEIYQLPAAHALKVEQSAAAQDDHSPEWRAVRDQVEKGGARFVTSPNILAGSGQRSQFDDADERIFVTGYEWENEKSKERLIPKFESRKVGALLKIDPVVGPDDLIIDLNVNLEYHTAPPSEKSISVRFPGSDQAADVPVAEFHVKEITAIFEIMTGTVKLLGAWRPTGKPEYEAEDVMQVAFLKADVQPVFRVGRIR